MIRLIKCFNLSLSKYFNIKKNCSFKKIFQNKWIFNNQMFHDINFSTYIEKQISHKGTTASHITLKKKQKKQRKKMKYTKRGKIEEKKKELERKKLMYRQKK